MSKISNHWVDHFLEMMRHSFWRLTYDRELTEEQYDKIKKTLKSFVDKFDPSLKQIKP